jgi:hypothetical protein
MTATSYEFVKNWFQKAQKSAAAQGKSDSAALWRDGLEHLESMKKERDEAVAALGMCFSVMSDKDVHKLSFENALKTAKYVLRKYAE